MPERSFMAFWTSKRSMTARCKLDVVFLSVAGPLPTGSLDWLVKVEVLRFCKRSLSVGLKCDGTMTGVDLGGGGH